MHPMSDHFRAQAHNTTAYCADLLRAAADELDRLHNLPAQECPEFAALELENQQLRHEQLDLMLCVARYENAIAAIAAGSCDLAGCQQMAQETLKHERSQK